MLHEGDGVEGGPTTGCVRALRGSTTLAQLNLDPARQDSPATPSSVEPSARQGGIPGLQSPGRRGRLGWRVTVEGVGTYGWELLFLGMITLWY
jgi:hypothetical protein